eukprot:3456506-Amphidinium_carterae.1
MLRTNAVPSGEELEHLDGTPNVIVFNSAHWISAEVDGGSAPQCVRREGDQHLLLLFGFSFGLFSTVLPLKL